MRPMVYLPKKKEKEVISHGHFIENWREGGKNQSHKYLHQNK